MDLLRMSESECTEQDSQLCNSGASFLVIGQNTTFRTNKMEVVSVSIYCLFFVVGPQNLLSLSQMKKLLYFIQ